MSETFMDSTDPRDNGKKIGALLREETDRGWADLYRTCDAGPSGQRKALLVGAVRYMPSGSYEFRIIDRTGIDRGSVAGYATRRPGSPQEWTIWREEYDGAVRLHGYASSLSLGVDALIHGDFAATGRHDWRRRSGGVWQRYTPAPLDGAA
jgi:hypothetical protein